MDIFKFYDFFLDSVRVGCNYLHGGASWVGEKRVQSLGGVSEMTRSKERIRNPEAAESLAVLEILGQHLSS